MDIETTVVDVILGICLGFSGVYIIFLFFKPKLKACCFGTNHRFRPWSPLVFHIRDWLYNNIVRNPMCFVTIVISCWSISILNLKPNPFINMNSTNVKEYIYENNIVTPIFEEVKKYDKNNGEFYSINLHGFENLVNVLLPLFFAVALQKYMTTRNEFLAFCGEVEFMAIYFMTLTNNESGISGKLESQLKRIKTILCMMPTTVYELEKNRDLKPEDLYYDHSNSYDGNWNRAFTIQRIKVNKLSDDENRINKSIYRDIKKLRKTGLGLFECLLHLLIGYIDKIKQEKSAYNTSIERDFIVKWNHINAGWGNIDNSTTYKTPILLDVMFRLSLCVYAFFKPRTILFTCENDVCGNIVWASFGAVFPYLILFVFSDILQDPFQDYKINPTVTKVAFDTQHNVKKLFNLQLGICETEECEQHHFSYDDGYDGFVTVDGNIDQFNQTEKNKMNHLKNSIPLDIISLVELLGDNSTLFNKNNIYEANDNLTWNELYNIMLDPETWKKVEKGDAAKQSSTQIIFPWKTFNEILYNKKMKQPRFINQLNPSFLKQFLRETLGWQSYDQIMFSIYASDNVRKHIQQIVFSGNTYVDTTKMINDYIDNLVASITITYKNKQGKPMVSKQLIDPMCPDKFKSKYPVFNLCNNEGDEKVNQKYINGLKEIWKDIKYNIEKDRNSLWSANRETKRQFQIDIFKNKNRDGHLKFV